MNHLESSFKGKNAVWRYIVMIAALLIASNTIGAIPLLIAYALKAAGDPAIISGLAENPSDMSILGLDPNLTLSLMLFPFLAALVTFILTVKPLNKRTFSETINGTGKIRWSRFFIGGAAWLIISAIYFFIYLKADPGNFRISNTSATLLMLFVVSILLIPFQATFEEVVFRGYLMQGFSVLAKNRWIPLVMTSILFGLMHSFNPEVKEFGFLTMMPQYVLFGLIFGAITVIDDGIEASAGAHTANNVFLCIMVTHDSSALQTAAVYEQQNIYPWIELAALLASGIILIFLLKLVFRWRSFSPLFSRVEPPLQDDQMPYTDVISSLR